MYWHMDKESQSLVVDRGIALHKMIRLITLALSGGGYLNFMGNEFGHPEWIDFPREGNDWSHKYARRQWSLVDNDLLRYEELDKFDKAMIALFRKIKLKDSWAESLYEHEEDQVLAFIREGYVFIFNFNPNKSFENYEIPVPKGKYKVALNSDAKNFGGFDRVDEKMIYETQEMDGEQKLKLYIPNRMAVVLKKG
jgi:1,4-alpha-glucan branching enzyme